MQQQMVLIFSPHGIMTGDTGYHLSGYWIQDLRSHRMSELTLSFMTFDADIVTVPFQHGQIKAAMWFMTASTFIDIRVFKLGNGFLMTGCTDLSFARLEEKRSIAGMWRVTAQTGVAIVPGQMAAN